MSRPGPVPVTRPGEGRHCYRCNTACSFDSLDELHPSESELNEYVVVAGSTERMPFAMKLQQLNIVFVHGEIVPRSVIDSL